MENKDSPHVKATTGDQYEKQTPPPPPPQPAAPPSGTTVTIPPPQPSSTFNSSHSGQQPINQSWGRSQDSVLFLPTVREKSLVEAYLLAISPFGIIGAHHFYLRRYYWGVLYFFTFGLCGCGYIIDWFRLPYLVKKTNAKLYDQSSVINEKEKNLSDAYTLWFPFGLLGFHHYYLGNMAWGICYTFTLGLCGIGWLVDLFRMPKLVRNYNRRVHENVRTEKSLPSAYALGVPLGPLGLHHFYLNRPVWGIVYIFTLGLMGLGWIVDWIRMPWLVRRCNEELKGSRLPGTKTVDDAYLLWFPFGLIGFHHFYLNRPIWGFVYFFTLGVVGFGWILDGFRMAWLVEDANKQIQNEALILPTSSKAGEDNIANTSYGSLPSAPPTTEKTGAFPPPPPPTDPGVPDGHLYPQFPGGHQAPMYSDNSNHQAAYDSPPPYSASDPLRQGQQAEALPNKN